MAEGIEDIIELLGGDGVTAACETVEAWTKAGRFDDLLELSAALEARAPVRGPGAEPHRQEASPPDTPHSPRLAPRPALREPRGASESSIAIERARFEAVHDHLEDQVAIAGGPKAIDALLALYRRERVRSTLIPRTQSMRACAFASRLGYGQTPAAFLDVVERLADESEHQELLACWLYEVVLRGHSLSGEPRAERLRAALAGQGHPLAAMPLELLRAEHEVPSYMPLYGDLGLGRAMDSLASGAMAIRTIPPPADGAVVRATRSSDAATDERLAAAVRPWSEGTSGKIEAKVFALAPAVPAHTVGSWLLRALPLDSTAGVARLECSQTGPDAVLGPLFSAASNGGAYSAGVGGAYGRLAAWTSLGALVGAPAGATFEAVEARAKQTSFLTFRAPGPWFYDVAWDLGVLAVREGGESAAVLAATDSD